MDMKFLSLPIAALVLMACAKSEPADGMEDTCGAANYTPFIGTYVDDLPSGLLHVDNLRIIGPTTPITKDLRPDRVNLRVDENDVILEVKCF